MNTFSNVKILLNNIGKKKERKNIKKKKILKKKKFRLKEGTQEICNKILEKLYSRNNFQVYFKNVVSSVSQTEDKVEVLTNKGLKINASYCVSTIPLNLQSDVEWHPRLSHSREMLSKFSPMGKVIKTTIFYKTKFWLEKGYFGGNLFIIFFLFFFILFY